MPLGTDGRLWVQKAHLSQAYCLAGKNKAVGSVSGVLTATLFPQSTTRGLQRLAMKGVGGALKPGSGLAEGSYPAFGLRKLELGDVAWCSQDHPATTLQSHNSTRAFTRVPM